MPAAVVIPDMADLCRAASAMVGLNCSTLVAKATLCWRLAAADICEVEMMGSCGTALTNGVDASWAFCCACAC